MLLDLLFLKIRKLGQIFFKSIPINVIRFDSIYDFPLLLLYYFKAPTLVMDTSLELIYFKSTPVNNFCFFLVGKDLADVH